MDRDELQDRIRARRSGADPYRRGGTADEGSTGGYQRFEPEPEDARARRARRSGERREDSFDEGATVAGGAAAVGGAGAAASPERPDITRENDDWAGRPTIVPPIPPPDAPAGSPPVVEEQAYVDNYDDSAYDDAYPYEYDEWDDGRDRRSSGAGAFAILGFLALGVLALLGGAVLAGVFNGEPNVGGGDPSATPSSSVQESPASSGTASAAPSGDASAAPSGEPPASGDPVVFPDGFTAEAQPCLPGSADLDGCDSNGVANAGAVDMWIGFSNGRPDDVLGFTLIGPDGGTISDGSIALADIDCVAPCGGYTRFPVSGLTPGTYQVEVTRNGDPAAETSFEVT